MQSGRKDKKQIHDAVHTSIVAALLGGVLLAILGELLVSTILQQLNVPAEVFPLALRYMRIYLIGMPAILLYNFESAVFRSVGETKMPSDCLGFSGVLNCIVKSVFCTCVTER